MYKTQNGMLIWLPAGQARTIVAKKTAWRWGVCVTSEPDPKKLALALDTKAVALTGAAAQKELDATGLLGVRVYNVIDGTAEKVNSFFTETTVAYEL